jgi:hypothetical protein
LEQPFFLLSLFLLPLLLLLLLLLSRVALLS